MLERLLLTALRLWNGTAKLALAFWGIFVPVTIVTQGTKVLIKSDGVDSSSLALGLAIALLLIAKIFSVVAVWRCAKNVTPPDSPLSWIARAIAFVSVLPILMLPLIMVAAIFGG